MNAEELQKLLADLSCADGLFLYQIMTTGLKIKISKTVFVSYLSKALCFKEDFLPVAVGFRNIAVHQYEDINCKIIFSIITSHLDDFKTFAAAIEKIAANA